MTIFFQPMGFFAHITKNSKVLLAVIAALLVLTYVESIATVTAQTESTKTNCNYRGWPSDYSSLEPDPTLIRGTLDNGFRYVLKNNSEPKNRVALYLYVRAGSLHETDEQQGIAHYLEHMMFNGTTHFPPGTLVEYFQSIGMDFGGDTNAHTTFDRTVYDIVLPGGSKEELASALRVMADYSHEALLLDSEIEKERGVILAEKRSRDSVGYRARVAKSSFTLQGTKYAARMPIGLQEVIENAGQQVLRDYYETWYRPDNMILVAVGDFDTETGVALIKENFGSISQKQEPIICPDVGEIGERGTEVFYHFEPELANTRITLESYWDENLKNDSLELEKRELLRLIGNLIMGYRFQQVLESQQTTMSRGHYYSGTMFSRIGYGTIAAQGEARNWEENLRFVVTILKQALQYGFSEKEVERAKKQILAELEANVETMQSEDSRSIAKDIIYHLNNNRVYQSALQEEAIFTAVVESVTDEEVTEVFQSTWDRKSRLISVVGDINLGEHAKSKIEKIFDDSLHQGVVDPRTTQVFDFPYLTPQSPESGGINEEHYDKIGVKRIRFPNGLIVNLKKTDFEKNRFLIAAKFGNGLQNDHPPGLAMVAEDVVNLSGTSRYKKSDISTIFSGSSAQLFFRIGTRAFSWSGAALKKDSEQLFQLLHTLLLDAGVRRNSFSKVKQDLELMYRRLQQQIEGAEPLEVKPFYAGYDQRYGLVPWQDIERLTYEDLSEWLSLQLKPKDLELSIVGDFEEKVILELVGKYFAGLQLHQSETIQYKPVTFPTGKRHDVSVETSLQKSLVTVAWPTDDSMEVTNSRILSVLAAVFQDRMRKLFREKLGATYSSNVSHYGSRVVDGYGYLLAQLIVEVGTEEEIVAEIKKLAQELHDTEISKEELERIKGPIITSLLERVDSNGYWLYSVLALSSRFEQQLLWPETIISGYSTVSSKQIYDLASKYLSRDKASVVVVKPASES